ncbi:ral guanine nucleotide dissociation stimulator-like [Equus caballus]|uniref:ral guanine nucleotide dissociation stimulator-like n=1 Tax=Equus caballus TaxID=9796 RepID=UPI0038B30D08
MLKGYQLSLQDQEQDEGAPSSQSHDTGRGHLVRGNTKLATDHIQVSGVNWHRFAVLGLWFPETPEGEPLDTLWTLAQLPCPPPPDLRQEVLSGNMRKPRSARSRPDQLPEPSQGSPRPVLSVAQETGQQLSNGALDSITLQDRKVPHTANRGQGRLRAENPSRAKSQACRLVWTVQAATRQNRVEHLVPAFLDGDTAYVRSFLCTYRGFATTQQVLELLFQRYGCVLPHCDEDGGPLDQLKKAISFILGTWLQRYPEDFIQPPDVPSLEMLLAYVGLNMPGSELEHRARVLLSQLEHPEHTDAETEAEEDSAAAPPKDPEDPADRTPSLPLAPTPAQSRTGIFRATAGSRPSTSTCSIPATTLSS